MSIPLVLSYCYSTVYCILTDSLQDLRKSMLRRDVKFLVKEFTKKNLTIL